jgi:hypothetical protein
MTGPPIGTFGQELVPAAVEIKLAKLETKPQAMRF